MRPANGRRGAGAVAVRGLGLRARLDAPARRLRARLRSQSGFALVELLVSALILTVGIVGLIGTFDSSRRLGTSAEAHQTAAALAEQELERVRSLPWARIALKEAPTQTSKTLTTDPTYYEYPSTEECEGKAAKEKGCYQWNWEAAGKTTLEPLVTGNTEEFEPTGREPANPHTVETTVTAKGKETRLTFKVYRFITWAHDSECKVAQCGTSDDKRILIAVTGSNLNRPVTIVTLVNNRELATEDPIKGAECESSTGVISLCVSQK